MGYRPGSGTNISMFFQGSAGTIGGTYEVSFSNGDMVGTNYIAVHNLATFPSGVAVYDENGIEVTPDSIQNNGTSQVSISLESYAPINGTWRVSLTA
jgi:hypothetical protein